VELSATVAQDSIMQPFLLALMLVEFGRSKTLGELAGEKMDTSDLYLATLAVLEMTELIKQFNRHSIKRGLGFLGFGGFGAPAT